MSAKIAEQVCSNTRCSESVNYVFYGCEGCCRMGTAVMDKRCVNILCAIIMIDGRTGGVICNAYW